MNLQLLFVGETSTHVRQVASLDGAPHKVSVPRDAAFLFTSRGKGPRADHYHEVRRTSYVGKKPQYMVAALSPVDIEITGALPRRRRGNHVVNRNGKAGRLNPPVSLLRKSAPPPVSDQASSALFLTSLKSTVGNGVSGFAEDKGRKVQSRLAAATPSKIARGLVFKGETESEYQARQRRCLATAIYFEARGEPVQGQLAVAQVVMNRVRSQTYPDTICGVVFQGQWRRKGCQFSFACDGIADVPREPALWELANKLAARVTEGKVWVAEVGHATHYHATYVKPRWRRHLDRISKIGRHIFYRRPNDDLQEVDVSTESPDQGLALAQSG